MPSLTLPGLVLSWGKGGFGEMDTGGMELESFSQCLKQCLVWSLGSTRVLDSACTSCAPGSGQSSYFISKVLDFSDA